MGTVSLISRDTNPLEVYACEFAIDNGHLGFVATDSDRNLSVFMYAPESPDSMGGHRLIRKADFHLGQHINCLWRVRRENKQFIGLLVNLNNCFKIVGSCKALRSFLCPAPTLWQ